MLSLTPPIFYMNRHTHTRAQTPSVTLYTSLSGRKSFLPAPFSSILSLSLPITWLLLPEREPQCEISTISHPRTNLMSLHGATPAYLVNCYFPLAGSFPPLYEPMGWTLMYMQMFQFTLRPMEFRYTQYFAWKCSMRHCRHIT